MVRLTMLAAAGLFTVCATGALAQATTLRVLDTFTETSDGMDALVAAFEAANPDIDVQRDVQAVDDMRPTIQTALNSGTGPDVFYYDTGPGFGGVLAKAGLVRPLDDFYASGALDHIYPWTHERVTFDGKPMGSATPSSSCPSTTTPISSTSTVCPRPRPTRSSWASASP